jgi:hypothetical protein
LEFPAAIVGAIIGVAPSVALGAPSGPCTAYLERHYERGFEEADETAPIHARAASCARGGSSQGDELAAPNAAVAWISQ